MTKNKHKRSTRGQSSKPGNSAVARNGNPGPDAGSVSMGQSILSRPVTRYVLATAVLAVLLWSYAPTLKRLVTTWNTEPDYSHGFLIVPLAIWFLWARRDTFPGFQGPSWTGIGILLASILMRCAGTVYYVDAIEDWSLIVWCAGAIALLAGHRVLLWSWPAVIFLFFMIPLPFRAERLLSVPLQTVATQISVWTLQLIGQPALAEGNVVWLGSHHLEVAEACSGLRVFMGVTALGFAYVVLTRPSWWEAVLLLAAVLPVALVANALRIVTTALLYNFATSQAAEKFNHDLAGLLMIPVSVLLFGLVAIYLRTVFPLVRIMEVREIVRQDAG